MKWYNQNYVNRRDWILDNLEFLKLTPNQCVIVLLIDFCNVNNIDITMEFLGKKTGLNVEDVNKVLSGLIAKKYLTISAKNRKVKFNLNKLFEIEVAQMGNALDGSLFEIFELEFKRPLTHNEMEKVSDWAKYKDKTIILNALKEASMYQKVTINYIEKVLNTMEDNFNRKMFNNG